MATNNLLRAWNFETPDVNNLFQPLQAGVDRYTRQVQQDVENQRADEQVGMQRERLGMEKGKFSADQERREVERIGRMAQVIDNERDLGRRSALLQRMYQGNPRLTETLTKYGVDPNDHANVPKFLMAQAGSYDPLAESKSRAEIGRIGAATRLAEAQIANLKAKAVPAQPTPDPLAGAGIDDNGNIVIPGQGLPPAAAPFAGLPHEAAIGQAPRIPDFSGRMNLGGPMDDIERSMRLDEGRPQGVRVAQAGGAPANLSQSPIQRAREISFGPAGVTSPDIPGIVTDAGRNKRMDVPATRTAEGQRAFDRATPEQQERLSKFRQDQELWTGVYKRAPRAGYYYGEDGREMPLTDKNFKGDREAQAVALMNFNKIEEATKKLLAAPYGLPQRAVQGWLNQGEVGQAFADLEQGATGLAYALSGKQVAVAEMKSFINAYKPEPFDSAERIKAKVERMKSFYQNLLSASRGGEPYERAFARAAAAANIKNPDGTPLGAPASASAGRNPNDSQPAGNASSLSTEELMRRAFGGR